MHRLGDGKAVESEKSILKVNSDSESCSRKAAERQYKGGRIAAETALIVSTASSIAPSTEREVHRLTIGRLNLFSSQHC